MRTKRFADVVAAAGKPESYITWVPPERDPALQRAIKQHRIMTVHQDVRGTRKDFGTVGFTPEPEAQFLVFPKSLKRFSAPRIVAINYDLLAKAPPASAVAATSGATSSAKRASAAKPSPPPRAKAERPSKRRPASPGVSTATSAAKPEPPRKSPRTARASASEQPKAAPSLHPNLRREIERATRELKSGKTVAAYERLQALLQS